jgi:hypothetical protein
MYWELMVRKDGAWPEADTVYRQARNGDAIGPLEIRVVRGGTFEEVRDNAISRGASIDQYKTPRCLLRTHHRAAQLQGAPATASTRSDQQLDRIQQAQIELVVS